jgi:multiple sugar transport system substrate-binding protein
VRKATMISVFVVLGILTVSCGMAWAQVKIPITYWYFYVTDEQHVYLQQVIAAFNAEHPHIKVEGQRMSGNLYDKTLAAIVGGAPPDVLHFERSAIVEWVASKGEIFEPLDAHLARELQEPDAFLPMAQTEIVFQGQTWAAPFDTDVRGLLWHNDVLQEAGIDSSQGPRSLDELDSRARKLTKLDADDRLIRLGFAPWIQNWNLQGWFWTFGGDVYDAETRRPTIDIPQNLAALKWVQSYAQRYGHQAVSFSTDRAEFMTGRLAMRVDASVVLDGMLKQMPDLPVGTGEVPWPEGGTNGTWSGGYCHVIPKGSKHVREAAEFINYLSQTSTQVLTYESINRLPTNTRAFREAMRKPRAPLWLGLMRQLPVSHGRPPLWLAVHLALADAQNSVLTFKKTPEQALQEVQQHMERQFAEVLGW